MTGSLQTKNGIYYAVLNLKDSNGKRKQKWINTNLSMKGNKRKADELLKKYLQEYSDYTIDSFSKVFFDDYIKNWVNMRSNIQPTTKDGYNHMLNKYIEPYFKSQTILLIKLNSSDINQYYNYLYECGLSSNTVHKHHELIHACLEHAYHENLIPKNVADYVDVPKRIICEHDFLEYEDIKKLLAIAKNSTIETPILLASFYGLRRSEILGLTWDCIDFEKNIIKIKQKVVRIYDKDNHIISKFEKKLKTDASYYSFPLISDIRKHLENLKSIQENNKALFGNAFISNDFVCTFQNGEPLKPDYVSKNFSKLLKKNNLKHIRFHDLRHSCGSLLLESGFSIKQIQEWLRHSSFNTTANIYLHCRHDSKQAIGNKLEEIFSNL